MARTLERRFAAHYAVAIFEEHQLRRAPLVKVASDYTGQW